MRLELDLELLTDVSLSASNRTLGEPRTHDHIPGRALWGAAACQAYRHPGFSEAEAFRLFHQGAVRVLDAVPLHQSGRTYPIPRAWHVPKGEESPSAHNFVLEDVREQLAEKQCKPLGEGWVAPDGTRVHVETAYSLRTSVDPSGRAREGLLFGLPALRAGSRFWSALEGEPGDVERVAALMVDRELRLGRSRNVEFGLVEVRRRNAPAGVVEHGRGSRQAISFLCASRCLFRDPRRGTPTHRPTPESFGLNASWEFDPASSFVRVARIVPFNSKRRRPETERFALERGSVVTFLKAAGSADLAAVVRFVEAGVGEHRGEGYGQVLVAPTWLTEPTIPLRLHSEPSRGTPAPAPTDELFRWVEQRARQRTQAVDVYGHAVEAANRFRAYRIPSAQWGVLRRLARESRFQSGRAEKLLGEVKQYLDQGKRKLVPAWQRARNRLLEECGKHPQDLPIFLELLASACMRQTAAEGDGTHDG